jgi:hypothetical protein
MPDFNIDDVLGKFGETSKVAPKSGLDVDSILSQFGSDAVERPATDRPRVIINTNYPKPFTEEETKKALEPKENPRSLLPRTNIVDSIVDNFNSGRATASEGLNDIAEKRPATGVGKLALGSLSALIAPITGAVQGGLATPITDITGNKDIGDRAADVALSGVPFIKGASTVVKNLPKNKALSTLVENIGPENLPDVVSAMKANPRLAPADLSPRVLQDTQHLFANEGPQIDYLAKTSGERMATRKDTMANAYDTSGGVAPDLAQKMTDLANAAKSVGNSKIQPPLNAAKPVSIANTLTAIDDTLKPGVLKIGDSVPLTAVKKELESIRRSLRTSKEYDAKDLHSFQSGLRVTADTLKKSSDGGDRQLAEALMKVRNNLVSDIDKSAPGYKEALHSYRDEIHIADAFKKGHDDIFTSSKKIENDPSFVKKWYEGLSDHEKQAATEGARAAIYTEMGVAKNPALAGESVARSDFNQAKMEVLFGKEETDKLLNKLAVERAIANTHNKIVEGSQTAMRTASKSQFALPTKTEVMKSAPGIAATEAANFFIGGYPGAGSAVLATAKVGAMAKDAVKMKLAREHNARYAQYALPTEGPSRDELIRQLEARIPGPKQSLLARGAGTISRLVGP